MAALGGHIRGGGELPRLRAGQVDVCRAVLQSCSLRQHRHLFEIVIVEPPQIVAALPQMKRRHLTLDRVLRVEADVLPGEMFGIQVALPLIRMFLHSLRLYRTALVAVLISSAPPYGNIGASVRPVDGIALATTE